MVVSITGSDPLLRNFEHARIDANFLSWKSSWDCNAGVVTAHRAGIWVVGLSPREFEGVLDKRPIQKFQLTGISFQSETPIAYRRIDLFRALTNETMTVFQRC